MALPADLQLSTLTGRYASLVDGALVQVVVLIEPQFQLLRDLPGGFDPDDTGTSLIDADPVTIDTSVAHTGDGSAWSYTTSGDGEFSVKLPGWADEQILTPTKFQYKITVTRKSDGSLIATYGPDIPAGTTVDLVTFEPNFKPVPTKTTTVVNVGGGGGGGTGAWDDLTGKPAVIAAGTTQEAARDAIGAVTLGSTSTTAKAGDAHDSWSEVTGKPLTFAPSAHTTQPSDISGSTTFGQELLSVATAAALRTKAGAGTAGSQVFAAADANAVLTILGLTNAAARLAAAEAAVESAPRMITESGGAYDVPVGNTRPIIFKGPDHPGVLMVEGRDLWLGTP